VPESWIPPAEILEARALIRLYLDLLEERGAWVERVDAALFHQGVPATSLVTKLGRAKLAEAELTPQGRRQVDVGLRQVKRLDQERDIIAGLIEDAGKAQPPCRKLVEQLYGVGWLLAYALWAELGDVRRFSSSRDVVRYTGMDVTVYSSGDHRSMGSLSRQGSPVLRWALYEAAVAATHKTSPDHRYYEQVKSRRQGDSGIALQSVMRRVARRVYHLMRGLPAEAWPAAA
jgi:transposase